MLPVCSQQVGGRRITRFGASGWKLTRLEKAEDYGSPQRPRLLLDLSRWLAGRPKYSLQELGRKGLGNDVSEPHLLIRHTHSTFLAPQPRSRTELTRLFYRTPSLERSAFRRQKEGSTT